MEREAIIAALESLPQIERISVARLQPTDVIVVECNESLPRETVVSMQAWLRQIWPNNKVVVCDEGTRLKVIDGNAEVEVVEPATVVAAAGGADDDAPEGDEVV